MQVGIGSWVATSPSASNNFCSFVKTEMAEHCDFSEAGGADLIHVCVQLGIDCSKIMVCLMVQQIELQFVDFPGV